MCIWSLGLGVGFRKATTIPGSHATGRAIGYDCDHDGRMNLVFRRYIRPDTNAICFFEHVGYDRYVVEDVIRLGSLWAIGDLDNDSLTDLVMDVTDSLLVYESPDRLSNPTRRVWFYKTGINSESPSLVADLDKDGRREILTKALYANSVFECVGDNQYTMVHQDTNCPQNLSFAVDDYDGDGKVEYAGGGVGGPPLYPNVFVYECVQNDSYALTFVDSVHSVNGHTVTGCNDLDLDGKPEFVITYMHNGGIGWTFNAWMFEGIGNNVYGACLVDSIRGVPFRCDYCKDAHGDVDGDGQDEFVWSTGNNWHVYKGVSNNVLQRVFSAYPPGPGNRSVKTNMDVFDLNGNGYPEVIESFDGEWPDYPPLTVIWEIEGVRLHRPNGGEVLTPGSQSPITWEKFSPPGADSFSLFVSYNNGQTYQTVKTGLTASDTLFLWSVPDSVSDSCRIMIWAYGPPRPGQNVPRGTAWDFSDSTFAIRQTRVTEGEVQFMKGMSLSVIPNPIFGNRLVVRYSLPKTSKVRLVLYNALGQIEEVLEDGSVSAGVHVRTSSRNTTSGVFFVHLAVDDHVTVRKIGMLE